MKQPIYFLLQKDGVLVQYYSLKKLELGVLLNGHAFIPWSEIEELEYIVTFG